MVQTFRTFCAIELTENIRSQIQSYINQLRAAVPESHASWTRIENIHLTLKFFGDVDESSIAKIAKAGDRAVVDCSPFDILIKGSGSFPKPSQARVLWIGVEDPSGKLNELNRRFENECSNEGFAEEDRTFRPHLTIARIRKPTGVKTLAETHQELGFESMKLTVNELVIFRSELSSKGSKYTALSRHNLPEVI